MPDLLDIARSAALAGGRVLAEHAGRIERIRTKSSASDLVTEVDIASGVEIVREIRRKMPRARFVVEEPEVYELADVTQGSLGDAEVWVIDPLDGTTSYLHGYPCYSVSVAILEDGQPVAGAVYAPVTDDMHWAERGRGAHLGDRQLAVTTTERIPDSLLVTGFPYDRGAPLDRQLDVLGAFLRAPVHGIRRDGSAALDLSHVAVGRCDGFWEFNLQPWDMAAGVLLCREAGGRVSDVEGRDWTSASTSVLAANPALHEAMRAVIEATA